MKMRGRMIRGGALLTVLLVAAGCAGFGGPSSAPAPRTSASEIVAEIDRVDSGARQIVARTPDGRVETVSFDERTQVMYRGQSYPVSSLERGDVVSMRLAPAGPSRYVDLISVQQSVQERRGSAGVPGPVVPAPTPPTGPKGPTGSIGSTGPSAGPLANQRIEGTVGMIDGQRGLFEVRTPDLGTLVVSLPYNPRSMDVDRFRRLRSGDNVRLSGRLLNAQRFELEQFL
jgi:hypothetical protein